jgi:hypothetical protein
MMLKKIMMIILVVLLLCSFANTVIVMTGDVTPSTNPGDWFAGVDGYVGASAAVSLSHIIRVLALVPAE